MSQFLSRLAMAVSLVVALVSSAAAQPPTREQQKEKQAEAEYQQRLINTAKEEYRQFYRKPETPLEYWAALSFEIDVGRYSLAADLLKGLVDATKNDPEALVKIEEAPEVGMSAFLRLLTVPTWVDDPSPLSDDPNVDKQLREKINKEARANAQDVIDRVTKALQEHLRDPAWVGQLVKDLGSDNAEDRSFGMAQLGRAGANAVPYLLETLQASTDAGLHERIRYALIRLPRVASALEAALETADPVLKVELIDILVKRGETGAVPSLWFPSASPRQPETVRTAATRALAYFLGASEEKLPPAKTELTRIAENYYQHKVAFRVPEAITVWQWKNGLAPVTMNATQAEEYYGLHFAHQALELDPSDRAAQVVFLSLALEKGFERGGIGSPLEKGAPRVKELLKTVNPDLVIAVLERALSDNRVAVIVGAVRALGELGEVRAARPSSHGASVLVRALEYPDRRVQMAAAKALLSISGPPAPGAALRLVEVLRRNLAADLVPTALVANGNVDRANEIGKALQQAGFKFVVVPTVNAVMSRLREAADIDVLLADSVLIDPKWSSLLAQLRADMDTGLLPVFVTVSVETVENLRRERQRLETELETVRGERESRQKEQERLDRNFRMVPPDPHDILRREHAATDQEALVLLQKREEGYLRERQRIDKAILNATGQDVIDLRNQAGEIDRAVLALLFDSEEILRQEVERIEDAIPSAPHDREEILRRLTERYPNVWVISEVLAVDPNGFKREFDRRLAEARITPLSKEERQAYRLQAVDMLDRLAIGEAPGYDVRPAAKEVLNALRSPEADLARLAIEIAGRLPGRDPQVQLAGLVLDDSAPVELRTAAAVQLGRNIQQFGLLLDKERNGIVTLFGNPATDAKFKTALAGVIGSMRPDVSRTGQRLLDYSPPAVNPAPAPAPPPAPAETKEKEGT